MIGKDTPPAFEGNIHILLSLKERDCANLINSKISAKNYTKNMMAPEVARNSYHNIKKSAVSLCLPHFFGHSSDERHSMTTHLLSVGSFHLSTDAPAAFTTRRSAGISYLV